MNYGFIGAGNMACSFIKGMLKSNSFLAGDIFVFDKKTARQHEVCEKLHVCPGVAPEDIIANCEVVFVAVKPNDLGNVLENISESVKKYSPLIVSFAAGKTVSFLSSHLERNTRIARIMPNLNSEISEGMAAYCCNEHVTPNDEMIIEKCLSAIGSAVKLDEHLFGAFTAVAGCAPAFVYLFVNAMATAAVKLGIDKKTALQTALQTVSGSASMIKETGLHPHMLIDNVCSPGGATIEGICTLYGAGFESAVVSAITAAYNKTETISIQ